MSLPARTVNVGGRAARPDVTDERSQAVDADTGQGRSAYDREDGRGGDAVGESRLEVFGGGHLTFQVALHHLVVGHDDALDQALADAVLELGDLLGDRTGRGLAAP